MNTHIQIFSSLFSKWVTIIGVFFFLIIFNQKSYSAIPIDETPPQFSLGGGYFDIGRKKTCCGLFQAEYKFGKILWRYLRPHAGLMTAELESTYLYLGLGVELYLTSHWVFTPSFSPGLYFNGCGKNLGIPIEFRSAVEFAYEFSTKIRGGVQFYHISNAHLSHRNPGANELVFFVAIPLY